MTLSFPSRRSSGLAGCQVSPLSLARIIAIFGEVDRQVGCKGCVQVQAAGNGVMASVTALKFAAGLLARIPGSDLDDACGRVAAIGRASCRERVCQYV